MFSITRMYHSICAGSIAERAIFWKFAVNNEKIYSTNESKNVCIDEFLDLFNTLKERFAIDLIENHKRNADSSRRSNKNYKRVQLAASAIF